MLAALRGAGFGGAFMGGSCGTDIIIVPLGGRAAGHGPEFLIGMDASMMDLPARNDLTGWRVLFHPAGERDDFTIYRGRPDDISAMVEAAAAFARNNGYLPRPTRAGRARWNSLD